MKATASLPPGNGVLKVMICVREVTEPGNTPASMEHVDALK